MKKVIIGVVLLGLAFFIFSKLNEPMEDLSPSSDFDEATILNPLTKDQIQVSPPDRFLKARQSQKIVIDFTVPMDLTTITTSQTEKCVGSIRVSLDGFKSCVPLKKPVTSDEREFLVEPLKSLKNRKTYQISIEPSVQTKQGKMPLKDALQQKVGFRVVDGEDLVELETYQFEPIVGKSESEAELKKITKKIDLNKTAMVLIDFYDATPNALKGLKWARDNNILIFHLNHEFLKMKGLPPEVLPLTSNDKVVNDPQFLIDRYFKQAGLDIQTVIYMGYGPAVCLASTRNNSVFTVMQRRPKFDVVVVKDAYESMPWVTHQFESIASTTRVQNLYDATQGGDAKTEKVAAYNYEKYNWANMTLQGGATRFDEDFGKSINPQRTALVLMNAWKNHPNTSYEKRMRENNKSCLAPLSQWAKKKGISVWHVRDGKELDSGIEKGTDVLSLKELRQRVAQQKIDTLVYAGNVLNSSTFLKPAFVYQFSQLSFPQQVKLRFVEDCVTALEFPEAYKKTKGHYSSYLFVERATYDSHRDTKAVRWELMQKF